MGQYEVNLRNHISGEKLMYRTKLKREEHFRKVGRSNKSSWFRKSGHISTITLPATYHQVELVLRYLVEGGHLQNQSWLKQTCSPEVIVVEVCVL